MRRGFTLIEVLIGVIVLALGLLGLAAVFPVVVREQKIATEQTLGASAVEAVRAQLLGNTGLTLQSTSSTIGWASASVALQSYREEANTPPNNEWDPSDPWFIPGVHDNSDSGTTTYPSFELSANTIADTYASLDIDRGEAAEPIPYTARLLPRPFIDGAEPRFVWDIALRASPVSPSSIEVAVFLRSIDPNIRVPKRERRSAGSTNRDRSLLTRSDVLAWSITPGGFDANGLDESERRLPVVIETRTGRPTLDGDATQARRAYSVPFVMPVDIRATPAEGNILVIDASGTARHQSGVQVSDLVRYVRIVGQKLLGDDGRVYTVVGIPEDEPNGVIVSPPLRASRFTATGEPDSGGDGPFTRPTQVVLTPQVPAEISIFTVQVR